jgi:A/G-specific adenine glycosylase
VQSLYPKSKPKKAIPTKHCHMLLLQKPDGSLLLEQRPSQGIWGGLWSFPEFESLNSLEDHCAKQKLKVHEQTLLPEIKHTFSHFHLIIQPVLCHIKKEPVRISEQRPNEREQLWYQIEQAQNVGLASPVKKLIQQVSQA